jgi:hypothetical protein
MNAATTTLHHPQPMNAVRRGGPEIPGVSLSASAGITNFYDNA